MRLSERTVTIILSDDGRRILQAAAIGPSDSAALPTYVQDTDDIGIWIRVEREDGEHVILVRWEYVLSVDLPAGEGRAVGLRS